jgi:PIN domain nuclease of toxin-antitoxin system
MAERLLLDTCALIWITQDEALEPAAEDAIDRAYDLRQPLRVSVMSAWEIGMLVSKGRVPAIRPPERWLEDFAGTGTATIENVTSRILVAASFLPGQVHGDPIDRILIATARDLDLTIVTRDRKILAYSAAGHVKAVRC